jgi:hypothetical protein
MGYMTADAGGAGGDRAAACRCPGTGAGGDTQVGIWELDSNGQWIASVTPGPGLHPEGHNVVAVGDFTGNGTSDVLWQNPSTGDVDEWQIVDGEWAKRVDLGAHPGSGWRIAGVGDFFGNGIDDILWTNTSSGPNGDTQVDIWKLGSILQVKPDIYAASLKVWRNSRARLAHCRHSSA